MSFSGKKHDVSFFCIGKCKAYGIPSVRDLNEWTTVFGREVRGNIVYNILGGLKIRVVRGQYAKIREG